MRRLGVANLNHGNQPRASLTITPNAGTEGEYVLHFAAFGNRGGVGVSNVNLTISACFGDCNGDGAVTIDELIKAVRIGLGEVSPGVCAPADGDGDGRVTINELVHAVASGLSGCLPQ